MRTVKSLFINHRIALLLLSVNFLILNTRTLQSIMRFPADPGYAYLYSGATNGIQSWFDLDPYVHFGAHFLSWLTSFAPLDKQAIVLAVLIHSVWSLLAVSVFFILNREGFTRIISFLSALSLALCPAASESSLANVGNIKWPLLILAIILVSSNQLKRAPKISAAYLFVTGITNPLSVILFLPLLISFFNDARTDRRLYLIPCSALLVSFGIQVLTVGTSGLSHGAGGDKVFTPWTGMGLFWWFGLVSPTIICLSALLLQFFFRYHFESHFITRIAVVAPALSAGSYLYGGIGDRYFVAPMVISWIVSLVFINKLGDLLSRNQFLAVSVIAFLVFLVPTFKWFHSSWYLNAGSTWAEEVKKAKTCCSSGHAYAHLNIGGISTTELPCTYIERN